MNNIRKLAVVALALTGALATGWAQARGNDGVQWSVTIGAPMGMVYSEPAVMYREPVVTYRQPVVTYQHQQRDQYQRPTRWDRDGDGIPNRYDRVYNPSWDRDGDGIPNRYDRRDNVRHDRDGDGIPNGQDRHDGRNGRGPGR
jgi:hypothetical protein